MTLGEILEGINEECGADNPNKKEVVFATSDGELEVLSTYPLNDGRICIDLG